MTNYDPNRRVDQDNTWMWVVGVLVAVLVIGGLIYAASNRNPTSASNPPATTTGQGQNAPAPASPPAPSGAR